MTVSYFILPDNASPGMIETLCINAVRAHPPLAAVNQCLDGYFNCLPGAGADFSDPMRSAKNWAQAYLATRPDAQMFPGIAAYRGYWPWESAAFEPLKAFLRGL
ncbi:MAG TPA: DUF3226 domain-containing protein [Tepidisphaeraceae bacterium]|nr:DUF3226 domain-containing protein [Tepidisphaeraceae bacterium]